MLRDLLHRHVPDVPGLVALVRRRGETVVETAGVRELGGDPVRRDSIFRVASMTKPVTAVAALLLVDEGRIGLDEPVDSWLPELADRRVLRRLDGPLDDTVPAERAITLRDLLTLRHGHGYILARTKGWPIQDALDARRLLQGPPLPDRWPDPDAWMARLADLPLMYQPGQVWAYDLGLDIAGVLVARVAGQPFDAFLGERIFGPLGMRDTGFHVPRGKLGRFTASYDASLRPYDPIDGRWARPPAFPMGAAGLVSTADDFLAFSRVFTDGALLRPGTLAEMTRPQITAAQQAASRLFLGDRSWGLGLAVGSRIGWEGGLGTSFGVLPDGTVGVLLGNRSLLSPRPPAIFAKFWAALEAA